MGKSKRSDQGQCKRGRRGGRCRDRCSGNGRFSFSRAFKKKMDSNLQKAPFDDDNHDIQELDADTTQRLEDNAILLKAFKDLNLLQDLPGFDTTAGQVWIYPTNTPVRHYQYQIVQTALFHNTLACLPTVLGKTFVAAVVMFNFHRWYPNAKIIFTAPTTPLLTQQLDACLHIVGIRRTVTTAMSGTTQQKKRDELWTAKKVFFVTPEILESDINRGTCPAGQIRCIVIDEAYKALGNDAYAVVIRSLSKLNQHFRVIALSATPATDSITAKKVLDNLLISKLELRYEYSSEILTCAHDKKVEPVIVPLEENEFLTSIHEKFTEQFQFYTGKLLSLGVIPRNKVEGISSFQLLQLREVFRKNVQSGTDRRLMNQKGYIELHFATCIFLSRASERLLTYGLRVFYMFFEDVLRGNNMTNVGSELRKNSNFEEILVSVQEKLKITLENSTVDTTDLGLPTSITTPQNKVIDTEETSLTHPKMKYLKNIVEQHFKTSKIKGASTRIMILSKLRDSVVEIAKMLCTLRPLVHPMVFYGQANSKTGDVGNTSKGLKQKEQKRILEEFEGGNFNTFISTSVGEDGLDIGDVDLIICYDSSNSPTTLVQRMGPTGRKRDGKIIFLLTKGTEGQTFHASSTQNRSMTKQLLDPDTLTSFLFPITPRMVPAGLNPECFKMNITIPDDENVEDTFPIEQEDEEHLMTVNMDDADFVVPAKKNVVQLIDDDAHSSNKTHSLRDTNNGVVGGGHNNNSENSNKVCDNSNTTAKNVRTGSTGAKQKSGDDSSEPLEDNFVLLSALLDIKDYYGPSSSAPPCVFVPLPKEDKRNVLWKEEYDELSESEFVISDVDLESIRERVDRTLLFGGVGCKCGNLVTKTFDVDDDNFNNTDNKMDIGEFGSYDDNFSITNQEALSGKMNNLSLDQNQENNEQLAATTTSSNISTTSPSISGDYVASISYNPKKFIMRHEATTNTTSTPVATGITSNSNNTTNTLSTLTHPFRTSPNPHVLPTTPNDQRNRSPSPFKATSPPRIYNPLASTPVRHFNQSNRENNLQNTVIASFDIGFVLDENDPFFYNEWDGEMEEEITEVPKTIPTEKSSVSKENGQLTCNNKFNVVNNDCSNSISNTNWPNISAPSTGTNAITMSNNSVSNNNSNNNSFDSEPVQIHGEGSSTTSESAFEIQNNPSAPKQQKLTDFSSSFHHQHNNNNTSNFTKSQTATVFIKDQQNVLLALESKPDKASSSTWQAPIKYSENNNVSNKKAFDTAVQLFPTELSSTNSESKKQFKFKWHTPTTTDLTLLVTPDSNIGDSDGTNLDPLEILISSAVNKRITPQSPNDKTTNNTVVRRAISPDAWAAKTVNNNNNNNTVIQSKDVVFSPELQNFKLKPKPRFLFRPSGQTSGGNNSNNNSLMNSPSSSGIVLQTPEELQITPMTKVPSASLSDLLVAPSPELGFNRRRFNVKRRIIDSGDTAPYKQNPVTIPIQTTGVKIRRNPFVLDEADQLDGDTSSGTDHDDKTDESKDTFVVDDDEDEEEHITGTQQQAMYIRSVKDVIPFRAGRIEKPLSSRTTPRSTTKESSEHFDVPAEDYDEDYVNDSFCSDGVQFDDIGVFTQAMNVAKQQLNAGQGTTRKLRPRK